MESTHGRTLAKALSAPIAEKQEGPQKYPTCFSLCCFFIGYWAKSKTGQDDPNYIFSFRFRTGQTQNAKMLKFCMCVCLLVKIWTLVPKNKRPICTGDELEFVPNWVISSIPSPKVQRQRNSLPRNRRLRFVSGVKKFCLWKVRFSGPWSLRLKKTKKRKDSENNGKLCGGNPLAEEKTDQVYTR